jgi:hypothetical protein
LGGPWTYRVQLSIKFVLLPSDPKSSATTTPEVDKIRVQAAGEIAESKNGMILKFFRGYDQVVLQNLFQDLQEKLGNQ